MADACQVADKKKKTSDDTDAKTAQFFEKPPHDQESADDKR